MPHVRSTSAVASTCAGPPVARSFARLLSLGALTTISLFFGSGCVTTHATSTENVELGASASTSFPTLVWSRPNLGDLLPHDGCTFGGATRRACRRGCIVRVRVREASGERDEEHRLADARRVVVVRRSDGSVSGRAEVSLEGEALDVFFESPRGAERGASHVLERMRDPHALENGEWLRRVLVRSRADRTHTLAESGDARLWWRHEAWVSDEIDRRIERRRTTKGEERTETTRDADGRLRHRTWVVDERGTREVARRDEIVRLDERGRVVELLQEGHETHETHDGHHHVERWSRRRLRTYDARGKLVETLDDVVEGGHAWRRRVRYGEGGEVISSGLEDLGTPSPTPSAPRGLLHELLAEPIEDRNEVAERVARQLDDEVEAYDVPEEEVPSFDEAPDDAETESVARPDEAGSPTARAPSRSRSVERDREGRVRREVTPTRTLERVYDESGRLVASRVRTVVRDEPYESDARYAYEGTCDDVEPPIVLGHEAETDSAFGFNELTD